MNIDNKVIEDIRNSASISQVISQYIPITKRGRNYVAVCPFHDDHNPSMSISEDKQIYKCFACGSGGNVFTFVKDYTKCSYIEAVVKVAEIIGKPIQIDYKRPKKVSRYQPYYDLMADSISFACYALDSKEGTTFKQYLLDRGLDKDIISYFDIGYMPKGDFLIKYLREKGHSDEDIERVGLGRFGEYGMYNIFANRIVFPIHDRYGNPIAYTARAIDDEQTAKYINTSETLIYHKGEVLYNYHRAYDEAKKANRLFVCEGVMDVIAMKRADMGNVVATLGTACTKEQLHLCAKATQNIVFFYDGDEAGQRATTKAVELAMSLGFSPSVIRNETGKDPDEILKSGRAKALKDLVAKEISGIEFAFIYYKNLYPFDSYGNKKAYMRKLSSLIALIRDDYDRDNFYHELVSLTGLPLENEKRPKKEYNDGAGVILSPKQLSLDGLTKAEYTILHQMMDSNQAVDLYRKELGALFTDMGEKMAQTIIDEYRKHGDFNLARLHDSDSDKAVIDGLDKVATYDDLSNGYREDIFCGALEKIKTEIKQARKVELEKQIKVATQLGEDTKAITKEYTELLRELGGKRNGH